MDIMQVKDLTFIHNEKKRWLKRPEIFQLGPVNLNVKRGETIAIIGETVQVNHCLLNCWLVPCRLTRAKLRLILTNT